MRLTCPNCGAIYEIDAKLIPATGRDVQCASCAHVWIQTRPEPDAPAAHRPAPTGHPQEGEDLGAATRDPESGDEDTAAPDDGAAGMTDPAKGSGPDVTPEETETPHRRPDEETLRILREEAALAAVRRKARRPEEGAEREPAPASEARAERRSEAPVPARPDRDEAPRSAAPLRPGPSGRAAPGDRSARMGPRRSEEDPGDLLPDIDEINSSLSGPARRSAPAERPASGPERRWPAAIPIALLILGLLALLYVSAPWIVSRMPVFEELLGAYVGAVDPLMASSDQAPRA